MDIAFAILAPSALMLAAHWFPWRRVMGADLPRPLAYAYGMGVILAVCTFLFWYMQPSWEWATGYLWIVALSAGAATLAAYAVDSAVERKHLAADMKDRLDAYER